MPDKNDITINVQCCKEIIESKTSNMLCISIINFLCIVIHRAQWPDTDRFLFVTWWKLSAPWSIQPNQDFLLNSIILFKVIFAYCMHSIDRCVGSLYYSIDSIEKAFISLWPRPQHSACLFLCIVYYLLE